MTRRLLLSYVGLAVLILLVLEVPLGVILGQHSRQAAISQATRDAAGLSVEAEEDLESHDVAGLQTLLSDYRSNTGAEVSVIDRAGQVVASVDADHDADGLALAGARAASALRGQASAFTTSDEGRPIAVATEPVGLDGNALGAVILLSPISAYTDHTHDIWLALALLAIGILAITALLGLALARSFSRPLAKLESAVARLGEGRLTSRAPAEHGPEEIRTLADQFNHMADRLEELITVQTRFVADASHQLRSPLTALRLRLENLEADLDPEDGEALAAAGREVLRLSRLVDGLLTLTRADGPRPEGQPVDVTAVLTERCEAWEALAAERRIELRREGPARPVWAPLVPGDLDQIVDNLLANALDASPGGTTIGVSLRTGRRDRLALHVTDQGPGMTAEDRSRAFDRFWQGPGTRGGHSGLGLAIVRQLAVRNGLDVELNPAEGGGLDAVVHLRGSTLRASASAPGGALEPARSR